MFVLHFWYFILHGSVVGEARTPQVPSSSKIINYLTLIIELGKFERKKKWNSKRKLLTFRLGSGRRLSNSEVKWDPWCKLHASCSHVHIYAHTYMRTTSMHTLWCIDASDPGKNGGTFHLGCQGYKCFPYRVHTWYSPSLWLDSCDTVSSQTSSPMPVLFFPYLLSSL